jgi:chemotaxis protein MotB
MSRKKKRADEEGPGWEVVFTALSIILVAFFCMLNSYSDMERGKLIEIARSLRGALTILPGGRSPELGADLYPPSPDIVSEGRVPGAYPDPDAVDSLQRQFEEEGGKGNFKLEATDKGLRITLLDKLIFESGQAEIKKDAEKFLNIVANTIKKSHVRAIITGHTDNVPISSELYPSNWELSVMRAVNVMRYMSEDFRIPLKQFEARGAGEYRPLAPNDTEEDRARNRRVEFMLEPLENSHAA